MGLEQISEGLGKLYCLAKQRVYKRYVEKRACCGWLTIMTSQNNGDYESATQSVVTDCSAKEGNENPNREEDVTNLEPFVQFQCAICRMNEKCFFGDLKKSDGFYPSTVFYMRDPFVPPQRVKGRKPLLSDFLVLGSLCSLCNQSVCLDKTCSIYFGALFCTTCITRERRRFPEMLLQMVAKAQSSSTKSPK
ncbi:hypothetical protein RB195_002653 [Necator americanus]|uniref:Cysteine-rich DPF motif domain-containing protein 1 n=1 Tax=Necator americanus TaxID=51031 RepID=A0ABR1DK19_NECAM